MSVCHFDEGKPLSSPKKVCITTTTYGDPHVSYTFSLARSRHLLEEAGIQTAVMLLQGMCHVDDARNAAVRNFLETDCTELLFIDADVSWGPDAIIKLCQRDEDVIGGVYPHRRKSTTLPVRLINEKLPDETGLLEVEGMPTGFLKIKRHVLEKLCERAVWYYNQSDKTPQIFERCTDEEGTRWGGDINFCRKWRDLGGKVHADVELKLGHAGDFQEWDSLGAYLRRHLGITLETYIPQIRAGTEDKSVAYNELFKFNGNEFAADPEVLALCVEVARHCGGPIIETGSGLSSVLMAAAMPHLEVYALENVDFWAYKTECLAKEAGVTNLQVKLVPHENCWYDLEKANLPHKKWSLGFCDGPPRQFGTRHRFLTELAPHCEVVIVDDYAGDFIGSKTIRKWVEESGRTLRTLGRAALITK